MRRMRSMRPRTFLVVMTIAAVFAAGAVQAASAEPARVAIVFAAGVDQGSARDIMRRVAANLARGGRTRIIDPAAFAGIAAGIDALPRFADWRAISAQALVIGHLARAPDGRSKVEFRLWDLRAGAQLLGYRYFLGADKLSKLETVISATVGDRLAGRLVHFPR